MKCPNCNVDLLMAERAGVSIDYCPQCRGIWLEKGKLETLLERSCGKEAHGRSEQDERRDNKRRDDNDDGDDEGGLGGFLGNIFGG